MKKFTLLLSAMLFSVMSFAGLGEGYTKVTDITTLAAGDKVVLYCDDAALGVTGYNGNKDATVGATGWVEYVVEAATGGVLLKDGEQYISLTAKNSFSYSATGSVCKVTADGILYITLAADGKDYLLYENANNGNPLYRMYVDKSTDSRYKPFYVYEVTGEGGGDNSGTGNGNGGNDNDTTGTVPPADGVITCAQAVEICKATGETVTEETYTIRGYVTSIAVAYNATYNNTSFWMADTQNGGNVFEAFRSKPLAEADKAVKVGDYVEVTGKLVNYNGNTPETDAGGTYTILVAGDGGSTEKPEAKPLTDGYTKVTNISALANGDKVVLYCDEYAVGVAGFDDYKSGVMAETGWVEYAVELVDGGMKLKDEEAGKYAALPEKNCFKYNEAGSVFTVTENALLSSVLEADGKTYLLYRNMNSQYGSPLCRMYVDKSGNAEYAPFYVYKVETSTGVEDVTTGESAVKVMQNGQVLIKRGENVYNVVGVQVK